jgi:hypothetical protein
MKASATANLSVVTPPEQKVLIFTGAGIGVPLGLPTSVDFIDAVMNGAQEITLRAIRYPGGTKDIEWLLSILETFHMEVTFTEYLYPTLVAGSSHARNVKPYIKKNISKFKRQALTEIKRIKKIIFEELDDFDPSNASELYQNLMAEIKSCYVRAPMSVITTNYDLTFETAIEQKSRYFQKLGINHFDFGFSDHIGGGRYDPQNEYNWNRDTLEFLKVHGSVDWHRDKQGNCRRSMSNTIPDNPDKMVMLYPGFKKLPGIEPFVSLHSKLHKRMAEADVIIVIGFAFRDSDINRIFEDVLRLRNNVRIYYFNPQPLDEHPPESIAPQLAKKYPRFLHIKKGIKLSENPLGLQNYLQLFDKKV